jgi:hypothetical protein
LSLGGDAGRRPPEHSNADILSRLRLLVFIALPVVVFALGVAVAAILALGWLIQHVIA